ncbi:MAG TPA: flavodoxin family protein [Candidatus Methanomethylophilaceae archaeon]|nr:flavodoxin family protein [Candidatus Methanomethylophilaceae archaeon]
MRIWRIENIKVLGISGSPHHNGNTEILLCTALRAAKAKGAETRIVRLSEMEIFHCRGCNRCFDTGKCIIDDGMTDIYPLLDAADVIIVSSPVHFSGLSSYLKQFIDRCQCLWARREFFPDPSYMSRKGAFISVGGQAAPIFRNSTSVVKSFLNTINVSCCSCLTVPGVDRQGAIMERPDVIDAAYEIGLRLVDGLYTDPTSFSPR